MNRLALLVLGAHRSGTSALAGALIRLGAREPKSLMQPRDDNPFGYWESDAFYQFHERLLRSASSEWSSWSRLDSDRLDPAGAIESAGEFRALLDQEFDTAPLFVVKDPRICRLVPFWLKNLEAAHVKPAAVLMLRSPLEVAESLRARDGFETDWSLLIWLRHVLDAEHDTRTVARSFVRYGDLLNDWRRVTARISADIGVTWPNSVAGDDGEPATVVRSELRHHNISVESIAASPRLSNWLHRTCRAINTLSGDDPAEVPKALGILDDVRRDFDEVTAIFAPIVKQEQTKLQLELAGANGEGTRLHERAEALRRNVEQLTEHVAARNRDVQGLRAQRDFHLAEIHRLTEEHGKRVLEEAAARASADSAARASADAAAVDNHRLANELGRTQKRVDELLASWSWRVTAPLRAAFRFFLQTRP